MGRFASLKVTGEKVFLITVTNPTKIILKRNMFVAITEILDTNKRSLQAHKRIGFHTIYEYRDEKGNNWVIVLWDWSK